MEEIWKDIAGYELLYKVSNLGNVKSFYKGKERLLIQQISKRGYSRVTLSKNSSHKKYSVHRLVAIAFIPNSNEFSCVNHIDENKNNNCVENLEWCNEFYNANYGNRNDKIITKQINDLSKSKPVVQLTKSGEFIAEYPSSKEAQRKTGINQSHILSCCIGRKSFHSAGGYVWKYKELIIK